jgi:hypothetical protein
MTKTIAISGLITILSVAALQAQHVHIQTLSGYCVDDDTKESDCCCKPHHHDDSHVRVGVYINAPVPDEFAWEQHEDSGWPSRRDGDLYDMLTN